MKTEIFNLSHGGKVLFQKHKGIRGISVKFNFTAGAFNDKKGKLGTAHFLEHAFFSFPNAKMTREEKSAYLMKFEFFNAYTSGSFMSVVARVTEDEFEDVIDFMTEQFYSVKFNKEEFEKEKKIINDEIKTLICTNKSQYYNIFRTQMIKEPHFNNLIASCAGTNESVDKITLKDLIDFKNKYITQNNLVVNICGNISKKRVKSVMKKYIEPRIGYSDMQGFLPRQANETYSPCYHYAPAIENGKALLNCTYILKHIPWSYQTAKEHVISRVLSPILYEYANDYFRMKKNLCYGCSLSTNFVANHLSADFIIECQEENLEEVINCYSDFLNNLPNNIDATIFEKHKRACCNQFNFDHMGISTICDAMYGTYIDENKKYNDAFRKKVYNERKSVTYEETNELYKTLFSKKPHVTIISSDKKYKDFDYKSFCKGAIKK